VNTTIKNKPVAFDFNKLAEEWGKPKSLMEIYRLVGRFPFKAKAVATASGLKSSVPVGTIVELVGFGKRLEDGFITSWRPVVAPPEVYFVINSTVKRWLLVED
jgi:hypothetical protein